MDTNTMIRELQSVVEKHKDDRVFTGQLDISLMCRDIIPKLEKLEKYEALGTVEECSAAIAVLEVKESED